MNDQYNIIKIKKQHLLDELYAPYKQCLMCPLGTLGRQKVVFGEGNVDAKIMFIGEGPGADEDTQGKPFVGQSGKLLTKVLTHLDIDRQEVFITNIVKCRPPKNRKPFLFESITCKNILLIKQIQIISPIVLCTLGASAFEGLMEQKVKITQQRGILHYFNTIPCIPTYHPAYILRNPNEIKIFMQDIKNAINKAYSLY